MKLELFKEIVSLLKKQSDDDIAVYKLGIDMINFNDNISSVVSHLIGAYYGVEGKETFDWWCYEKDWGKRKDFDMTDADGNILCKTIKELHQYLEENRADDYRLPKKLTAKEREETIKNLFV